MRDASTFGESAVLDDEDLLGLGVYPFPNYNRLNKPYAFHQVDNCPMRRAVYGIVEVCSVRTAIIDLEQVPCQFCFRAAGDPYGYVLVRWSKLRRLALVDLPH